VIVAVAAVEMMQMLTDKIVNMVSMGRLFVTAVRSVSVPTIMPVAIVFWCAGVWIGATHRNGMLIDMTIVDVMQVPVVKIVRMTLVSYSLVTTGRVMSMTVRGVFFARRLHKVILRLE
jgi:hypothetical protein